MKASAMVNFGALCSVPFVMVLSNSMLIPVLPAIQHAMRIDAFKVGLIITAFSVPAGLAIPLGGYLSDRFGRKTIMVPALFIFGLGGLLAGIAPLVTPAPFWPTLAARILQGIGGGGTYQLAMALTGDIFQSTERSKALGLLEAANGLGKVVAPIIGAAAAILIWYAPFYVYPVLAWPSAVAVWFLVTEPRKGKGLKQKPFSEYVSELKGTWQGKGVTLMTFFMAGMTVLFLLFGLLSYYSDILESRWAINGFKKGLVMAIPVLVMAVTAYLTGLYMQKRPVFAKACLVAGLAVIAASMGGAFLLRSLYGFSLALAVLGLGSGLVLPSLNLMVTSAAGAAERGTITAVYGSVRFFGAALGPPVAGRLAALGPGPLTLGAAAIAAAAAMVSLLFVKSPVPDRPRQGHTP